MLRMFLIAAVFLCGCSKSHSPRGNTEEKFEIPGKIELKEDRFPILTDAQVTAAQSLLERLQGINRLRRHVLVSPNESDKNKEHREGEYQKLTPEEKSAVARINTLCKVTDEPDGANLLVTDWNLVEELRTTGAGCPVVMTDRTHLRWTVLHSDEKGESGTIKVWDHRVLLSEYKETDLARANGAARVRMETLARGLMEVTPDSSRTYARVRGEGVIEFATGLVTGFRVSGEYLDRDEDQRDLVLYVDVTEGPAVHSFALHIVQDGIGGIMIRRFFIGNRELGEKERDALGASHFAEMMLK